MIRVRKLAVFVFVLNQRKPDSSGEKRLIFFLCHKHIDWYKDN